MQSLRTQIIMKSDVWVWKGPWFQGNEPPLGSEVHKLTAGHESETRRLCRREKSFATGSGGWELELGVGAPGANWVFRPRLTVASGQEDRGNRRRLHNTHQQDPTVRHACQVWADLPIFQKLPSA